MGRLKRVLLRFASLATTTMSSTPQEEYAASLTTAQVLVLQISTLSAMYFVYGLYVILFGTCLYMMRSREKTGERHNGTIYLVLTTVLFVLSTLFVAEYTINLVRDSIIRFTTVKTGDYEPLVKYFTHDPEKTVIHSLHGMIPILLNIMAEWLLIHRCYVIWGSDKRIAVPLVVTSAVVNSIGITTTILVTLGISDRRKPSNHVLYNVGDHLCLTYDISSSLNNLVLTSLTAGRIWWIRRQCRAQGLHSSDKVVESVSRIILESGMLYPITTLVDLIVVNTVEDTPFDPFPISTLCAGIAPTLIMVRAKLGKNVESLQCALSDIRFTSGPTSQEETNTSRSQVHVHSIGNLNLSSGEGGSEEKIGNGEEV